MLVAQKFRVHRDVVIARVRQESGIDMYAMTSDDIVAVIALLEDLRFRGLGREPVA
jgi:hypothetical protein